MNVNTATAIVTVLIILGSTAFMYLGYRLLVWSLKSRRIVHKPYKYVSRKSIAVRKNVKHKSRENRRSGLADSRTRRTRKKLRSSNRRTNRYRKQPKQSNRQTRQA